MVSTTPRPHLTPGKDQVPILQEAGWATGRSGRAENLVPTGIRSRIFFQPVAQSLYRLSYPAHYYYYYYYYYYYFCKGSGLQVCFGFISIFYLVCLVRQKSQIPVCIVLHSSYLSLCLSLLFLSAAVKWPGHESGYLSQPRTDVNNWSHIKIYNKYTFVDRQYLQYLLPVSALSAIIRGTI